MRSMVAMCIPPPNPRRLASSVHTFFTHLDSVFYIFQFSNPFLPIASKRKGRNLSKHHVKAIRMDNHVCVHFWRHLNEYFDSVDKAQNEVDTRK